MLAQHAPAIALAAMGGRRVGQLLLRRYHERIGQRRRDLHDEIAFLLAGRTLHRIFMHLPCWNLKRAHGLLAQKGVTEAMEVAPGYGAVLAEASGR